MEQERGVKEGGTPESEKAKSENVEHRSFFNGNSEATGGNSGATGPTINLSSIKIDWDYIRSHSSDIIMKPKEFWPQARQEEISIKDLYLKYVLVLAAIPVLCRFIKMTTMGESVMGFSYKWGFISGIGATITTYLFSLVGLYLIALIVHKLAPKFQGTVTMENSFKLIAFSATISFVAGFFELIPGLGILMIAASLYGFFVLWHGIPVMTDIPEAKRVPFLAVLFCVTLVVFLVLGLVAGAFTPSGQRLASSPEIEFEKINLPGGISLDMNEMKRSVEQFERMVPSQNR